MATQTSLTPATPNLSNHSTVTSPPNKAGTKYQQVNEAAIPTHMQSALFSQPRLQLAPKTACTLQAHTVHKSFPDSPYIQIIMVRNPICAFMVKASYQHAAPNAAHGPLSWQKHIAQIKCSQLCV